MTVNRKAAKTMAAKTAKVKTGKASAAQAAAKKPVTSMRKIMSAKSVVSRTRDNQAAKKALGKSARKPTATSTSVKPPKPSAPSSKNKNTPKPKPSLSNIGKATKNPAPAKAAKTGISVKSKRKAAPVVPARGKSKESHNVIISDNTAETVQPKAPAVNASKPSAIADKGRTAPQPKARSAAAKAKAGAANAKQFTHEELLNFYHAMLDLCKRLSLQVTELRQQSLLRHDEVNQDEDGTDAFERVTSLDRASADQSQIFQINNAIRAIRDGSYGLCDVCGEKIEKSRLKALPFAKTCIECQSQMENGPSRRRPTTDLWD